MLGCVILVDDARVLGPRADDGHLAPQDIDELRELVDFGAAQPRAEPEHPRIMVGRDDAPERPVIHPHGPQLVHRERAPVASRQPGPVENLALVREPDAERRERKQWAQHHERQPREHDVHQSLDHGEALLQGVACAVLGSDRRRARGGCCVTPLARSTAASRALNVPAAHTNMTEAKS